MTINKHYKLTVALKDVTPIPSLPTSVIKTQQRRIYPNIGTLFVDLIRIAWTHSRYERN